MTVRSLAAAATLTWGMAVAGAWTSVPVVARDGDLPEGEGREIVQRACGDCHGPEVTVATLWTRPEWEQLVEDMIGRGAPATPDEQPVILEYLFANFGRVNVNRAPQADLAAVLRLTPEEATAIADYRAKGQLTSIDDLRKVPGVDAAKLERRKEHITFAGN